MVRFILLVLLIAAGVWVYFFLDAAGAFRTVEAKFDGTCKQVSGVVGVEDLTIDPETKIAYLSGYDRRAGLRGKPTPGAIWSYDLAHPETAPVNLTPDADVDFLPHGISLYRAYDGRRTLFVVNHGSGRHSVEVFDILEGRLIRRRSITGDALVAPNDIVAVDRDAFFVTNDHANAQDGIERTLEDYLRLKLTTVYYYDGSNFTPVFTGIGGANGINVSADGTKLFLAAGSEQTVYVYDRDLKSGRLTRIAEVPVPGYADNIELEPDGSVLVGVHSKIFDLLAHMRDPAHPSPSNIVRIAADGRGGYAAQSVYANPGSEISGASVAATIDKHLLVGAIFDPKVLDCDWPAAP